MAMLNNQMVYHSTSDGYSPRRSTHPIDSIEWRRSGFFLGFRAATASTQL